MCRCLYDGQKIRADIMRAIAFLAVLILYAFGGDAGLLASEQESEAILDLSQSQMGDEGEGIALDLTLSRAVPYRAFLIADPPRLVLDLAGIDADVLDATTFATSRHVTGLGLGAIRLGWTRIVAELDGPFRIVSAEERGAETGAAGIELRLMPASAAEFAKLTAAARPAAEQWEMPKPASVDAPKRRQTGDAPLVVVLDPGHGGIDPGAEADGVVEADVMLGFARELADRLREGGMRTVLTREADIFVPLETRISIARAAGADVFLSLHADALAEGRASGATVYLLADEASDRASAKLAERHDRADLLAGVDLSRQDDSVALVMMDLARAETRPRSERLAAAVAGAAREAGIKLHRHPIQKAAFSVLKSPDIPSVLLEVGFLSSEMDRDRLNDPEWRGRMQAAILAALQSWARDDAAEARLIRK